MKRLVLVAGIAALALAGCKKTPEVVETPVAPGPPEYCAVAQAYLTERLGRMADKTSLVVTAAAPAADGLTGATAADFVHSYNPAEENPFGWPKDPPNADLAQAWLASPRSNVLAACPGLEAVVTTAGFELVNADERPARRDQRLRLAVTLPMVTAAGDEALLLEVGRTPGNAGGADVAVHLRKGADGAWKEVDVRMYVAGFVMPEIPDVPPEVEPLPAKKKR